MLSSEVQYQIQICGLVVASSFVVYIDESGDEGFNFSPNASSHWFVLSALVVRTENDHSIIETVANVRTVLSKKKDYTLHFRDLKHEHRLPYVRALAELRIRILSVLIYKPCLKEPETFTHSRLYHYAVRYLLERVSWLCRDTRVKGVGDGSAKIIFSNRTNLSYDALREYVSRLIGANDPLGVRIDASVIKPEQISSAQHNKLAGLQAVDAAASSFYFGVQPRYGCTEPRYVDCLRQVIYRNKGQYLGYGVKFWPKESERIINETKNLAWIDELLSK